MPTKLTKPGAKQSATANQDARNVDTLAPLSESGQGTPQNPPAGSEGTVTVMTAQKVVMTVENAVMTTPSPVMTPQEIGDMLARLQDILSLWVGSDNRIMGKYLMVALPVPAGVVIGKVERKTGHDKVFTVDGNPVAGLE